MPDGVDQVGIGFDPWTYGSAIADDGLVDELVESSKAGESRADRKERREGETRSGGESRMVRTGNTHHANSHSENKAELRMLCQEAGTSEAETVCSNDTGGVDWLSVAFHCEFQDWGSLRAELLRGLELANQEHEPQLVCFRDRGAVIKEKGTGSGYNSRRFLLCIDGFEISFSDRVGDVVDSAGKPLPNVYVEVRGLALLEHGLREMLSRINALFVTWGMQVTSSLVSRVDLCADVVGLDVNEAYKAYIDERVICRSEKFGIHGRRRKVETFGLGSKRSPVQVRLYNKIAEIAGDERKVELMKARRWGGAIPDSCTRVEFQLRRERLKELEVCSLKDLLVSLPRLTKYLTSDWLRFTADDVDRTHTTRALIAGFWQTVVSKFDTWVGEFEDGCGTAYKRVGITADRAMRSTQGMLRRVFAELRYLPKSADEAVEMLRRLIDDEFPEFLSGIIGKMSEAVGLEEDVIRLRDCSYKGDASLSVYGEMVGDMMAVTPQSLAEGFEFG